MLQKPFPQKCWGRDRSVQVTLGHIYMIHRAELRYSFVETIFTLLLRNRVPTFVEVNRKAFLVAY